MRILSLEDDDDEEDEHVKNEDENGEIYTNEHDMKVKCGFQLSFTPQQAHIFGGQSIFLSFVNIDTPLHKDIFYYVVFKGSKLQHITSAKVLNPYTLQAVIPDHNVAELVMLSVHQYINISHDHPDTNMMATDTFVYTSDSSQFLTQQLALNVDNSPYLLNLQNVYSSLLDIPMHEKQSLDHKLTTSFKNLSLPPDWSLVSKTKRESEKSWTLFHFCAKYNFTQLAEYLLTKPGATEALNTCDEWDRSPSDISMLTKHKKMSEILAKTPSAEPLVEKCEKEKGNPTVKRHKLGTTTLTSNVTPGKDIAMKDLALLMEYDALGTTKDLQRNGCTERDEITPLAESLKKLHEIKDEIQRLRNINAKEQFDRLDGREESFAAGMVLNNSIENMLENGEQNNSIENMLENGEEHLVDENMNERDKISLITVSDTNGETEIEQCETTVEENKEEEEEEKAEPDDVKLNNHVNVAGNVDVNDISINDISIYVQDDEKPPKLEMQVSNISLNIVDVQVAECVEAVCEEPVQDTSVLEFVQCVVHTLSETNTLDDADVVSDVVSDVATETGSQGELSYQLESVTEETEEELSAAGTGSKERSNTASSLNDLPPLPNKRVGVLRKSVTKKDRPLSDSFENLRMVEKQGIVDFFMATREDATREGATREGATRDDQDGHELHRGHSLDTLTKNIDDDNENEWSSMSVNECHGSQESVSSDSEYVRDRTDSGKSFVRTRSLLSLSDLLLIPRNSSEEKLSKKSSSLFHRLSFKKAKSLTSLDVREEKKSTSKIDKAVVNNTDEFDGERVKESHHVRSESYDSSMNAMTKSKSSITISKHMTKETSHRHSHHEHSDEDTDEGTSTEIGEQHPTERKSSSEDKQKGLFSILRTGSKGSKEKKQKKKVATAKQENVVTNKSDSKKNFQKRGGSFRQNMKHDSSCEKLQKSASVISSKRPGEKRSSDRKSPSSSKKFQTQILEVPEGSSELSDSAVSPLNKNLSSSQTSLNSDSYGIDDDTDAAPYATLEDVDYPDLERNEYDDIEAWSELVDKKVQKKLTSKEIKRQDVIFELIKTETQYVRVLQIMKKMYHDGMKRYLHYASHDLTAMFPVLEDLIELHSNFLHDIRVEQTEHSENYFVKRIGNVILKHFHGENGKMIRDTYGYFCSRHLEAVAYYKELAKSDKKFLQFNRMCLANKYSHRLSVPECITRVTVRITKYPILLEAIIKATNPKDHDHPDLIKSLSSIKEILSGVDEDVDAHEQQKELDNLRKNLDKNVVEIKNEMTKDVYKYKAHRLFHKRSRLLYDKRILLKSKTKNYETRMIILADKIIFFQDNGGKLHLLNVDNKLPVMSLKGVMVRENAADSKALFLMNKSEEKVELYEIIFENHKEKAEFMPKLDKFITNCPDEEEENVTDNEEEARREEEERLKKVKRLMEQLEGINRELKTHFEEKNKTVLELIEITDEDNFGKIGSPCNEMKPIDVFNTRVQLEDFLSQVNSIFNSSSNSSNSPASTPCQGSQCNNSHGGAPPKKADTFGGFDNRKPNGSNNVARATSLKPIPRSGASDTDTTTTPKQRRQSQFIQVLTRSKTMGSTEDLSSVSSASSTSLSNFNPPPLSELQIYQHLSIGLGSLLDVTNQQDLEMAKMRYNLQEARTLQSKTEAELSDLREQLTRHQKESERQLQIEKDTYARRNRELKRSMEKSQKLEEQHAKSNSDEMIV